MLVDGEQSRWLVLLFLLACALRWCALRGCPELQLLLVVTGALGAYSLALIGTPFDNFEWTLLVVADRMVLHVTPIAALGLCWHLGRADVSPSPAAATAC